MVAPGANYSCSLPHHDHGLSYSPKNLHGGTDSSHDKWPHYASLTNVSTQKQLPRAYILRDASTSKPQPAKMSGLAGQAELYTFSLIKNLIKNLQRLVGRKLLSRRRPRFAGERSPVVRLAPAESPMAVFTSSTSRRYGYSLYFCPTIS